jgi:hypothetical protein
VRRAWLDRGGTYIAFQVWVRLPQTLCSEANQNLRHGSKVCSSQTSQGDVCATQPLGTIRRKRLKAIWTTGWQPPPSQGSQVPHVAGGIDGSKIEPVDHNVGEGGSICGQELAGSVFGQGEVVSCPSLTVLRG